MAFFAWFICKSYISYMGYIGYMRKGSNPNSKGLGRIGWTSVELGGVRAWGTPVSGRQIVGVFAPLRLHERGSQGAMSLRDAAIQNYTAR
jgi:hypothetical protein